MTGQRFPKTFEFYPSGLVRASSAGTSSSSHLGTTGSGSGGPPSPHPPSIPGRAGCRSRRSAQDRMRCSGSETFVTSTSAILYDSTDSLFIDDGGAWISCLSCSLAHSLSVPPFHPPPVPTPLSLLLSLCHFSFFLYLFPPFPLSAPTPPSALSPSLLLSPLDLSLSCTPFLCGRRQGRLLGGKAAHPLRHFPLLDLYRETFLAIKTVQQWNVLSCSVMRSLSGRQSKKAEGPECCKRDLTSLM